MMSSATSPTGPHGLTARTPSVPCQPWLLRRTSSRPAVVMDHFPCSAGRAPDTKPFSCTSRQVSTSCWATNTGRPLVLGALAAFWMYRISSVTASTGPSSVGGLNVDYGLWGLKPTSWTWTHQCWVTRTTTLSSPSIGTDSSPDTLSQSPSCAAMCSLPLAWALWPRLDHHLRSYTVRTLLSTSRCWTCPPRSWSR